ncbi:MAG: MarR family transcriptional regulator [Clostridia bacterium]|nr:MarR family transcriptional regulator [Clostridia bacterium]
MMKERYDALDMNNKLIWNFRDIGHTLRRNYEGRGSQARVLIVLSETGPIQQSDLTRRLGIQAGSASEVLGKLEAAGYILRAPSRQDRRTIEVSLTETGKEAAFAARRERDERHERMFSCLDEEEKARLLALLEKLNRNWNGPCQDR